MPQKYKQWDVVVLSFPFTDGTISKNRPAVISSIVLNDQGGDDVILCAITGQPGIRGIEVPDTHPEYKQTGLRKPSRILPWKIFTIAKSEISYKLGSLGNTLKADLKSELKDIFR